MKKHPSLLPLALSLGTASFVGAAFDVDSHPNLPMGYAGYQSCKMCHPTDFEEHANQVKNSIHWTWETVDAIPVMTSERLM
jgi:hypothetical protein